MTRNIIKEQMRKVKWATERETGKKLGKKGLIEVQKVVMAMNTGKKPQQAPEAQNWQEKRGRGEPVRMTVDLAMIIGRKF